MVSDKKYYNIRRFKNGVDMGVIDIPESHLEMTLKNHPDWVNLGEIKVAMEAVAPPVRGGFACPICGAGYADEAAMQAHKAVHVPVNKPLPVGQSLPTGGPVRLSEVRRKTPAIKQPVKNVKKPAPKRKR